MMAIATTFRAFATRKVDSLQLSILFVYLHLSLHPLYVLIVHVHGLFSHQPFLMVVIVHFLVLLGDALLDSDITLIV